MKKINLNIKKHFISTLAVFAFAAASLGALEWGGIITDTTRGQSGDFNTYTGEQSNSIFLWMNSQFSQNSNWYFSTEFMYKYSLGIYGKTIKPTFTNIIDADLIKVSGITDVGKGSLELALGRYPIVDNSGIVINQVCDGALAKLVLPAVTFDFYAGYTGLLNGLNVTMLEAKRDEEQNSYICTYKENADFYVLAHPFIPMMVSMDLGSLWGNQGLSLQSWFIFDLDKKDTNVHKGNRLYGTATLKGPISNVIYYEATSVFGTVDFKNITNYSRLQMLCYPIPGFSLKFGAEYASGKQNLNFDTFTAFTSGSAYCGLNSPEYGGQLIPYFNFMLFTGKIFYAGINSKIVFVMNNSTLAFGGVQEEVDSYINIYSDLQIGLNFMMYVDMVNSYKYNNANLKFSMRMTF